ncbi:hypothetical protein [Pseudogemmobacter sonorensis]|uniref:hypothetical protein n=1 Tax=Pseudogemmobacter sonorensis TaxID=2989681 RepID=UPI003696CF3C
MTGLIDVTIAAPLALLYEAGQLARCIGYTEADGDTFERGQRIGGYAVASGPVHPAFVTNAVSVLVEPPYGADMAAAAIAQAAVQILAATMGDDGEEVWDAPIPGRILAVVGLAPDRAHAVMGLAVETSTGG